MAESIALWSHIDGQLQRIARSAVPRESQLEDWIESRPDILGERLLVIGRQLRTAYGGIIDLLAIDVDGRCVVIELKKERTPRDVVAQTLDYVSWVASLSDPELRDFAARTAGVPFADAYARRFGLSRPPEQLNLDQRMLIVSVETDEATTRIIDFLSKRYGVDINVVNISYFVVAGQQIVARSWTIDPGDLEYRVDSHVTESASLEPAPLGLWHVNVGVHPSDLIERNWDDPRCFGFLSAGQGPKWRDEIARIPVGDHVYAYLNGAGYVGGGQVVSVATRADQFVPPASDRPLRELAVTSQAWFVNSEDPDMAEYMIGVRWDRALDPNDGLRVAHPLRGTVKRIRGADLAQTLRAAFG